MPQRVPAITNGASDGNCFIAAYAAGIFKDPTDIGRWVATDCTVEPNPANYDVYAERMNTCLQLYRRNADLMHETSREQRKAV